MAMSIPGIGFTSAVTIPAEIGDFKDFAKAEPLADWSGLVPAVYQSIDKLVTASFTKYGSRHYPMDIGEVAQAIAKTNKSKLKRFFLEVWLRKGTMWPLLLWPRKYYDTHPSADEPRDYREDEVTRPNLLISIFHLCQQNWTLMK